MNLEQVVQSLIVLTMIYERIMEKEMYNFAQNYFKESLE